MTHPSIKRRTVLAGLLGAGTAALAGCNSGGGGDGTLNVWGGVPAETGPTDLINAFMKENPDIKVTYTRYVNDEQGNLKLDTSLQGGVPIDVFFSYGAPALTKRTSSGLAIDLTDRINKDPDLAALKADADPINNFVLDGKLFCLPVALAPLNVYVNGDMVEEAGITLPETWSVEEFRDIAKKLTVKGKTFGSFNGPTIARPILGSNAWYKEGGKKSNFDAPEYRQEMELKLAMQKEGITMPQEQILAEKLEVFSQTPFVNGTVAMVIGAGHLTRYISDTKEYPHDFKTICMPPPNPQPDGGEYYNDGNIGDLMSISAKSENVENAWKLLKFWAMNAGKYMIKGGRLPAIVGDNKPEDMTAQLLGPEADTLFDAESFQRFLFESDLQVPVDSEFAASTQISLILKQLSDEVLLGDRTVDSWVTEMVKQSDAAIASVS